MRRKIIKTFDDSFSVHLARVQLESEGIQCFIRDEHIVSVNPLFNFAVDGIKLEVSEEDAEKALEILQKIDQRPLVNNQNEVISCPNCKSTNLYKDFKSMKGFKGLVSMFITFFLLVFPIFFKRVYKCKNCGIEFENS